MQNICSLNKKTRNLEVFLASELDCEVLAITEHWLNENELKCIHLQNFHLVSSYCRNSLEHGGTCIYLKNSIKGISNKEVCDLSVKQVCEISAVNLLDYNMCIVCI